MARHTPKTAAATDVKNRFGDYLSDVLQSREPLLIERHGQPVAVLVDAREWLKTHGDRGESPTLADRFHRLAERIRKHHSRGKQFDAVALVRQVREDEDGQ